MKLFGKGKRWQALNYSLRSSSGQGMTEYILIIVLVAVAALVVVSKFGKQIAGIVTKSSEKIESTTKDAFGKK